MTNKKGILSNFDFDSNLSDCSTDENLNNSSFSDTSSSDNGTYEDCSNEPVIKNSPILKDNMYNKKELLQFNPKLFENKKEIQFFEIDEKSDLNNFSNRDIYQPMSLDSPKIIKEDKLPAAQFAKAIQKEKSLDYFSLNSDVYDGINVMNLQHDEENLLNIDKLNPQNKNPQNIPPESNISEKPSMTKFTLKRDYSQKMEENPDINESETESHDKKEEFKCEEKIEPDQEMPDKTEFEDFERCDKQKPDFKINSCQISDPQDDESEKYNCLKSPKNELKNECDQNNEYNQKNEYNQQNEFNHKNGLDKFDAQVSIIASEADSENYQNSCFDCYDPMNSLKSSFKQFYDSSKLDFDQNQQLSARSSTSVNVSNYKHDNVTLDEKRFQNLQDEINLLNILMYEAENKTDKCGSLYNSFTNEINNNFVYGKASRVVDDCGGSMVSLVDGASSKFDGVSVKSELLFSDYGKSESICDLSEIGDNKNNNKNKMDYYDNEDMETKSVSSINDKNSLDSHRSDSASTVCRITKSEQNINEKFKKDKLLCEALQLPVEDRIIVLWNQIIRLKCTLKNLQLNLKEQQMETLMQINEFLINQNTNSNQFYTAKKQQSEQSLYNRENERNLTANLSESSLIFTENNRVRENLAMNNLKIALIECDMLSSTASSLVNTIPKYEIPTHRLLLTKNDIPTDNVLNKCCCEQIKAQYLCSCTNKIKTSKTEKAVKFQEKPIGTFRQGIKKLFPNIDDSKDRKAKSNEEIGIIYPEAKYCLSEPAVFE